MAEFWVVFAQTGTNKGANVKIDKAALAKKKADREKAKMDAAKAQGDKIMLDGLEGKWMPVVKEADAAVAASDAAGAVVLYQSAMDAFRAAGFKRPMLKQKLDAAKELLKQAEKKSAAAGDCAAVEVDQCVEVDQSVEVQPEPE